MSFVLHFTSRAASGRKIVRSRRVEREVLMIGRDPASDIHLTDLEVTLRHAEIRRIGPQRVAVRALASLPVLVDGRSTEYAEIDVAKGGDIRIGAARIALSAGESDGTIAVAVTRDGAQLEGAEEAGRRFSLAGTAIGKRPMAWTLALAVLAIFLAWPIWSFTHTPAKLTDAQMASGYKHIDQSWSSGPLSRAHAGIRDCKACHVEAFVAVPDTACQSCHKDIAPHADADRQARAKPRPEGLAGLKLAIADMFGRDPGRCVDCHAEHSGPGAMPAVAESQCAGCHADLKAKLPDTKVRDAGDFSRAHPQFRPAVTTPPGDYPRFTRVALSDPAARVQDSGLKFPHALHLSQAGGVARMQASLGRKPLACAECHVSDDSGARFRPVSMERNCEQCHSLAFDRVGGTVRTLRHGNAAQVIADILAARGGSSPAVLASRGRPGEIRAAPGYGGGGGGAAMIRAIFSPKGMCYDCHVVVPPGSPGELDYRIVPVREQLRFLGTGWFDHAAHATTTCASCHAQALTTNDSRVLMLPGIATCRQCHGGDQARAPLVRSTCAMCHDYHRGTGAPHALRSVRLAWGTAPPSREPRGREDADSADFGPAPGVRSRRSR